MLGEGGEERNEGRNAGTAFLCIASLAAVLPMGGNDERRKADITETHTFYAAN
jgi:hypothetical protein